MKNKKLYIAPKLQVIEIMPCRLLYVSQKGEKYEVDYDKDEYYNGEEIL